MTAPWRGAARPRIFVPFPALGSSVPIGPLSDAELGAHLRANPPHWIFHLEVLAPGTPTGQRFEPAATAWIEALALHLGLGRANWRITPRELVPRLRQARACPEVAFTIPQTFQGTSWSLAVALGLAGASSARPLPPCVLSSGCLPNPLAPDLRLTRTRGIEAKVRLALGRDPEFDIRPIISRYYAHPGTPHTHGPRELRTVSGSVRLLLIPTDVEGWSWEVRRRLGAEPIAARIEDFGQADPADLARRLEEMADGGLLVVQVPDVWQALRLLGCQADPRIAQALAQAPYGGDSFFFRIGGSPTSAGRGNEGERRFRERRAADALRDLDVRLRDVTGFHNRLLGILRACIEQLAGRGGNIARTGPDPDWLDVVACSDGPSMEGLLRSVPAHEGINGLVLQTGGTQVAEDRRHVRDLAGRLPASGLLETRYGPEDCQRYRDLLQQLLGCMDVPLKRGDEVIGVLCVHLAAEGPIDPVARFVVEKLAERAGIEVANQMAHEQAERRSSAAAARTTEAIRQAEQLPLAAACDLLGRHLAAEAVRLSGGYRAAVRLLGHDHRSLAVIGLAGGPSAWPPDFRHRTFARTARSACNHALDLGASYLIPDTRRKDVHYEEVHPPATAHLAILLRSGSTPVGLLSVDFDQEHGSACNDETRRALEELAAPYANHLHLLATEQLYGRLDASMPSLDVPNPAPDVLARWLEAVGQALGVESGSLFLRDPDTGLYRLQSSLTRPDGSCANCVYAPGEGRTGWVALHKRPLRVGDCADRAELHRIDPPLQRSQQPDCWDRHTEKIAYLGVPVLMGDDVLGVLRFICKTPKASSDRPGQAGSKERFTALDEQLAQAAASRLGRQLYLLQKQKYLQALRELAHGLRVESRLDLCRALERVLRTGVGACHCLVRTVDRCDSGTGETLAVLDRLYHSDGMADVRPQFPLDGDSVSARVCRTREPWVSMDLHADLPAAQMGASQVEACWPLGGCAVVAPLLADSEAVGTLAVHRPGPHALLQADVAFIREVAEQAGPALHAQAQTEVHRIQDNLLWSVLDYFYERQERQWGDEAEVRLLRNIAGALMVGLDAHLAYAWVADPAARLLRLLPGTDGGKERQYVPWEIMERELGDNRFVVVSSPPEDDRLAFFLEALPEADRLAARGWQRVGILLARTRHLRLLQSAFFFLVVRPPHRLSYARVESVVRMLTTTLIRQT
jgi:GAF domain-containing protein